MVFSWGFFCLVFLTLLRIGFCVDHPCGSDLSGLVYRTQVGDGTRNIEMTCKTGGNSVDPGTVRWVHMNASKQLQIDQMSDASKYSLNSIELTIKNVSESDEGKYSCTYNTNSPGAVIFCLEVVGHPVFYDMEDTLSFTSGGPILIPVKFVQMRIGHGNGNFVVNRLDLFHKAANMYQLLVNCHLSLAYCIGLGSYMMRANTTFDPSFNITFVIISANETDSGQYEIRAIITGSVTPSAYTAVSITLRESLSLSVTSSLTTEISQPRPSKSSTDHHYEATNSKHGGTIVTESPAEHSHFNIFVEPEESVSNVHKQKGFTHQSYYILLTCGVISGVLLLLIVVIVITGVLILTVRRPRSQRKNWSQLIKEEKVSAMKQSAYINSTYEFFDKVTQ